MFNIKQPSLSQNSSLWHFPTLSMCGMRWITSRNSSILSNQGVVMVSATPLFFDMNSSWHIGFPLLTAWIYFSFYDSRYYTTNKLHPSESHLATFARYNATTGSKHCQGKIQVWDLCLHRQPIDRICLGDSCSCERKLT